MDRIFQKLSIATLKSIGNIQKQIVLVPLAKVYLFGEIQVSKAESLNFFLSLLMSYLISIIHLQRKIVVQ